MLNQYGSKGLNLTAIADSTGTPSLLENLAHDWHAENIRFVADSESKMAKLHSASAQLTTLLISPDGREISRWEGFASAAEVGLKLRSPLGTPSGMAEIREVTNPRH